MSSFFSRRVKRSGLAASFVIAAFAAVPALAGAATTVTVNTTADLAPAPGACVGGASCSLRQAIEVVNPESGSNRIIVPAGHYSLTIAPTGGDNNETGDLNIDANVTIEGAGARKSVIDASAIVDRSIELEDKNLRLIGLGITGGRTTDNSGGAGILQESGNLRLERVAVTNNIAAENGDGGGIANEDGNLTIVSSTISGNKNSGDGGGIAAYGENFTVENSTIANNEVDTGLYPGNPNWGAYGGAIESDGDSMVLKNTTITGNHIVDNNGGEEGEGAALAAEPDVTEIANTIIANNTGERVELPGQCVYDAPYGSLGHNIETPEPAGEERCFEDPTDRIADPMLGALANNGGETDTVALLAGSPAIDSADPTFCLLTDQRGQARVGSACDIGAFEYVPPAPAPTPPPAPPAPGTLGFKGVKLNQKKGTAQIKVSVTGSGTATLTGKGVKKVTKSVSTGVSNLAVVPTGKLKKKLGETGKAKVKVTITFKTAVNTVKKTKSVTLKLK